ncbi:MAG TPA: hypothetical protein DD666_04740 [Advenella kashmirensis]|uniref:Uncharacterized protein n=1 Tax=Advenella kashmirensis TaxID=310575 RepID=A0A356LCI3_9BURK|nr:hypothetical protein [Advenella kashmirensis]
MQLMNPASIIGIAIGASLFTLFSKKNKDKTRLHRFGLFIASFFCVLVVLLAVNFGIYYFQRY